VRKNRNDMCVMDRKASNPSEERFWNIFGVFFFSNRKDIEVCLFSLTTSSEDDIHKFYDRWDRNSSQQEREIKKRTGHQTADAAPSSPDIVERHTGARRRWNPYENKKERGI
jgi:hypothetical protein